MSFQSIFSVILIVVFIAAAGIVVRVMLKNFEYSEIVQFRQDLKSNVENIWTTTTAEKTISLSLPSKISHVCFSDNIADAKEEDFPSKEIYDAVMFFSDEDAEVFFYNPDVLEGHNINPFMKIGCGTAQKPCLEISETCCIINKNGVAITLKKEMGNANVQLVIDNCVKKSK